MANPFITHLKELTRAIIRIVVVLIIIVIVLVIAGLFIK